MVSVVDPERPSTWPQELTDAIHHAAQSTAPQTLGPDVERAPSDAQVVGLLGGRPLLGYHATRLLPHEVVDVQRHGLRRLSRSAVAYRLTRAVQTGALAPKDAEALIASSAHSQGRATNRDGRVCVMVGRGEMEGPASGIKDLLGTWGGEALYWFADQANVAQLRSIGTPTVVVVRLQLSSATFRAFPSLGKILVAQAMGLTDSCGEVHYFADVPGSDILTIWNPSDREYARFPGLPRS